MTETDIKYSRRRKFPREIYTPGSGPLRKSGKEDISLGEDVYRSTSEYRTGGPSMEGTSDINMITEKFQKVGITSSQCQNVPKNNENLRKNRKPDCEIYIPKPVQNRLKEQELRSQEKPEIHDGDFNRNCDLSKSIPKRDSNNQDRNGKRRDRKKKSRSCFIEDDNDERSYHPLQRFRSRESLCSEEKDGNSSKNRTLRHGSEPRSLPISHHENRLRDLRSIDTSSFTSDKNNLKPPMGRRGSLNKGNTKYGSSFDLLPPRLQKKFMEEQGMHKPTGPSPMGTNADNSSWNGSSLTFQGKPGSFNNHEQNMNNRLLDKSSKGFSEWSKTLPMPGRTKGRGRLTREYHAELSSFSSEPSRFSRSLTPEKMKDGQFENASSDKETNSNASMLERKKHEKESRVFREIVDSTERFHADNNKEKTDNRNRIIGNYGDKTEQAENSDAENVIDWAAEVERCEQQDPSHLSRSNSRESFAEPAPPNSKERRKKKKRVVAKDKTERSDSHERLNTNLVRRGSVDSVTNHSRGNSIDEKNWRERSGNNCRSRQNSSCDNRSRQSSVDRDLINIHNIINNRFPRSRNNSSCENWSRQSSLERRDRDRYHGNGRARHGRGEDSGSRNRGKSKDDKKIPRLDESNWRREQVQETTREKERTNNNANGKQAGILILPQPINESHSPPSRNWQPPSQPGFHRKLYDPSNPDKPIMVSSTRAPSDEDQKFICNGNYPELPLLVNANTAEQMTNSKPLWYNPFSENFQAAHNPTMIRSLEQADGELQYLLSTGDVLKYWERMQLIRTFLKEAFKTMILNDLRFCAVENVEQHMWKILYYNVIELFRKLMAEQPESKESFRQALLNIIDEGTDFYEQILHILESNNNVNLDKFLNTPVCMREHLKYNVLPLISAQKIYLCLGDLTRYKEQANETCNYGLARQWYMKAHQINPKNGRPYNQLAILALYTKRKLDAVYYYMRCLMSSNPISAAKESLMSLFDESRKKYEAVDKKRKEEKAKKEREKMKEKEGGGGIRREIWIHPGGRKNMHRTTSACKADCDSEDEALYAASNIEVNKKFVVSYLHVHGKIYTKIGLESLTETAVQMLKQFRALLQHSPIPLNSNRFLQLFALNMFAIEVSQPKGGVVNNEGGTYRSATQESALVISLQMFNLLLERFVKLLQDHIARPDLSSSAIVPPDCIEILPALKVWCDWLMTHVEVWNPPPSCQDYNVGPAEDCWTRIATVVNLLSKIDYKEHLITTEKPPDHELVYLPEDATLSGFTPLMANIHNPIYRHKSTDMELAQVSLRIHKILFFGTVFLCGLDPPVLKLQKVETGLSEYISVVDTERAQEQILLGDHETWSESEDSGKELVQEENEGEMLGLAARRRQLQEQASRRISQMARITNALTEMEIRPRDLIPDTNCFIDCLPELEMILKVLPNPQHPYVLMVPLVVVNELEGLSRGCKPSQSVHHSALVRETAKAAMALFQKKHPALRTCTTQGTMLSSTTFTHEEDTGVEMTNDDKILKTCIKLCRTFSKDEIKEGGRRKLYRDVVLLTDDRNLVLKAMGRDMPVRSLPDFIRWAGLG